MTGLLVLSGAPVATLGAATKGYVDTTAATGSPVKAWVNFSGVPLNGTYTRVGTLITVTMTAHGMTTGQVASLSFTTGGATSGSYTVTVLDANTFSGSISGNVTRNNFIRASYNVSSVADNGVGNYTINFTTPMVDANYSWTAGQRRNVTIDTAVIQAQAYSDSVQTASALQVLFYAVTPATSGLEDALAACIAIFR
jgi:hypothetical protein